MLVFFLIYIFASFDPMSSMVYWFLCWLLILGATAVDIKLLNFCTIQENTVRKPLIFIPLGIFRSINISFCKTYNNENCFPKFASKQQTSRNKLDASKRNCCRDLFVRKFEVAVQTIRKHCQLICCISKSLYPPVQIDSERIVNVHRRQSLSFFADIQRYDAIKI